jgi:hypothetical protein
MIDCWFGCGRITCLEKCFVNQDSEGAVVGVPMLIGSTEVIVLIEIYFQISNFICNERFKKLSYNDVVL